MMFKRIMLLGIVLIFMTGTLTAEAAPTKSSTALEPWATGVIDQAAGVYLGQHVSIDHYKYNGRAYVSYYDASGGDLRLAYEVSPGIGNCPGNKDWKCDLIDGVTNDVGKYSSIDVFEAILHLSTGDVVHYAKIGISYYDDTDNSLKYAMQSCREVSDGAINCPWITTTVDDDVSVLFADNIGTYTSSHFNADGAPVIYYHGQGVATIDIGYVKRAHLTGSFFGSCDAGWTCEVVAQNFANTDYGTHISADGDIVAFYDSAGDQLVLARPSVPYIGSGCGVNLYWNCVVVDTDGDVGRFVSLVADPLHMVYYDATHGKIKHASGNDGFSNCGDGTLLCEGVDTIGVAGVGTGIGLSMTLDAEGAPIIAYQDFSEDQSPAALKIARPSTVYGNMIGNCGETQAGYQPMYWQCEYLDGGGAWVNEADYAAVSVSPAGLATVAYYETDDHDLLGRLKVIQQHFNVFLPLTIK